MDSAEKLLPHLQASLALDWTFPLLRPELEAASARAFEETGAQERFLAELDTPAHEDRARLPTPPLTPLVLLPKHPGDVVRYEQFVRLAARGIAGRHRGAEVA